MGDPNDFQKPKLPAPKIPDQYQRLTTPHFSTPSGMLLKSTLQPPPMFGLRGSTIAPKFLPKPPPTYKELIMENPYKKPIQPVVQQEPHVFCEFCDRAFRDDVKLDKHKLQSHKDLMGIKPRVYTEEEINEWKEARRKRYPTTQNVLARQQAQEERKKRGERLEESKSRFGRKQDRRQPMQERTFQDKRDNKGWQSKRSQNTPNPNKKRFVPQIEENPTKDGPEEDDMTLNGLPKFQGTSNLVNYERTRVLKQTNALSSLGSYGSGTETESEEEEIDKKPIQIQTNSNIEVDDPPEETPIIKVDPFTDAEIASTPNHEPPPKDTDPCEGSSRKRQRKRKHSKDESQATSSVENPISNETGSATPETDTVEVKKPQERNQMRPKRQKTTRLPWNNRFRRYQNTMLEKLLLPEIRHERNVLLQCVRFVVQNNFFGVGSSNNRTETSRTDAIEPHSEENTSNLDENE